MRISRRTSHTTATLRRTAAAGTALALAALTVAACSSSASNTTAGQTSGSQSAADPNANENDIQILNSLQLTATELDTAFATDGKWQPWPNADQGKLLIKQAQSCTNGLIDTKAQAMQPVTTAFKADQLPGDSGPSGSSTASTPASSSSSSAVKSSSSGKKGTSSSTPSSSGTSAAGTGAGPDDGNPAHWVVSTAIAYQTSDAAQSAVSHMGRIDQTETSECGGPADKTPIIGGGIGEVGPSWDNSLGIFVYVDSRTNTSVAVVAQRRGRFVVLTYTRGGAKPPQTGYYDLEGGPDTGKAADAATGVLGQLTTAVVNRG